MDYTKILENISCELRKQRQSVGFSQEELAYRAGIDRSYLSEIETSKKSVSLVVFIRIAAALDIPADVLLKRALG